LGGSANKGTMRRKKRKEVKKGDCCSKRTGKSRKKKDNREGNNCESAGDNTCQGGASYLDKKGGADLFGRKKRNKNGSGKNENTMTCKEMETGLVGGRRQGKRKDRLSGATDRGNLRNPNNIFRFG